MDEIKTLDLVIFGPWMVRLGRFIETSQALLYHMHTY